MLRDSFGLNPLNIEKNKTTPTPTSNVSFNERVPYVFHYIMLRGNFGLNPLNIEKNKTFTTPTSNVSFNDRVPY
jgi:hypothetical protein